MWLLMKWIYSIKGDLKNTTVTENHFVDDENENKNVNENGNQNSNGTEYW